MTNILMAFATDWTGRQVPCHFKATADSAPLNAPDEGWVGSLQPVYTIPPNTNEVVVTAKPVASTFWEKTVTFSVSSNGSLVANADSVAFVVRLLTVSSPSTQVTSATILVSRFDDVTTDVVALLKNLSAPDQQFHQEVYGAWPPNDWDLHGVPDAHFLDLTTPVKSGVLNFVKAPSLAVKADNVVLRCAGVEAPQLFSVTWPHSLAPKKDAPPTPFLLYVRQTNSNYVGRGRFGGAYPLSFDYADIGLFESLHYGASVERPPAAKGPAPLFWPYSKGVPYQVAKAGVDVVTVCPCPRYYGADFKKEYGVLNQTEETGRILLDLQAFMFTRARQVPPSSIGKTAIAAFSSGNDILKMWLDPANQAGSFLKNTVRALYFLDPRSDIIDNCIRLALDWAGPAARDKRIRLYNRIPWPSHKQLLDPVPSDPFVRNSADNRRTLSVVQLATWKKTVTKIGPNPSYQWDWGEAHHLIAATMLTHALAQGDF